MFKSSLHWVNNTAFLNVKLVTLRDLQGESQVLQFHLLVDVGFLPIFNEYGSLT